MLCSGCGNEVSDPASCPVCRAGRGPRRAARAAADAAAAPPACPRCAEKLEEQDWEEVKVSCCPTCRGTFFPGRGLEVTLDKLRATVTPTDVASVLTEFKDRFTRTLPDAVRYKACPVCHTVMTRRNYAKVSGVIIDLCGNHGSWVDEAAFAELANFITRGGDVLASKSTATRTRLAPPPSGTPTLLDRIFGGGR
ncbi:MAG: zf-TFIIB domain-containing protein [Planctomycetaceae bacterium]